MSEHPPHEAHLDDDEDGSLRFHCWCGVRGEWRATRAAVEYDYADHIEAETGVRPRLGRFA
jgi:hypothetical protein